MESFATIEDLQARWRTLDEQEQQRAQTVLADVTAYITAKLNKYGIQVDAADEVQQHNLVWVTCNVARRSLTYEFSSSASGDSSFGAPLKGYKQSADVFSEEFTYANPLGDMYLTSQEESVLGIGRMRMKVLPVDFGGRSVRKPSNP